MGVSCSCFSLRRVFGDTKNAEKLVNSSAQFLLFIMKKFFLSLVATMIATASFAQGSLLATLSHDGEISTYYGTSALSEAMSKAVDGDAITLSAGQFNAVNITKAITLRGAGMSIVNDSVNSHESTILTGEFTIDINDSTDAHRFAMEGLYINSAVKYGKLKNAQFLKCRFPSITSTTTTSRMTNTTFIHSRIRNGFALTSQSNAYFINCAVCNVVCPTTSFLEFDNCFVKFDSYGSIGLYCSQASNTYYKNCIIQTAGGNITDNRIPSNCTVTHCVGLGTNTIFDGIASKDNTNVFVSSISSVFKTYSTTSSGTYISDPEQFELTDEAKTKYLGADGTQVGLHGGNLPYDENPTTPQITKCNVAAKSTADGKLSVDIEIKAAE